MPSRGKTFTREELYDLVWSTPMTKASAELGITGNGLAKICDRLAVPYPYRGYWAKLQAGKAAPRTALKPAKSDTPNAVEINPTPPKLPKAPDPVHEVASAAAVPELRVPDALTRPHRIIAARIEEAKQDRQRFRRDPWLKHMATEETELDRRQLRIEDALFKALEKRGHKVETERGSVQLVHFVVSGEKLSYALRERIRQRKEPLSPAEAKDPLNVSLNRRWKQLREPTGELTLAVEGEFKWTAKASWTDMPDQPLEAQLGAIVVGIEAVASVAAQERAKLREAEQRRWEEEQRRAAVQRARKLDDNRWRKVREMAAAFEEADRLRRFIAAVEERYRAEPTEKAAKWVGWARDRLTEFDPLANGPEPVLAATEQVTEWSYS